MPMVSQLTHWGSAAANTIAQSSIPDEQKLGKHGLAEYLNAHVGVHVGVVKRLETAVVVV
jgi:hypothetical protein